MKFIQFLLLLCVTLFPLSGCEPLASGLAMGIAVNPAKPELLLAINAALSEFLNDGSFRATYNKYLTPFVEPKTINTNP